MNTNFTIMAPSDFYQALRVVEREYKAATDALSETERELREFRKDEEIKRLNEELHSLRNNCLHMFGGKERERYRAFRQRHYEQCGNGGHFVVDLSAGGIGQNIAVICPECGASEDITDTSDW